MASAKEKRKGGQSVSRVGTSKEELKVSKGSKKMKKGG